MSNSWWTLKTLSLIHVPPWKYWLLTQGSGEESCSSEEVDVRHLATDLGLKDVDFKKFKALIERANQMAFAFDKLIASMVPEGFRASNLVNIFRPEWYIPIGDCKNNQTKKFREQLRKLSEEISGAQLSEGDKVKYLYMALYLTLESLWHRSSDKLSIPLADPRIPTYTIFEYLRTTASMINAAATGEWVLVSVDIPGIQSFISKGRKTKDFWAGSWILSLLVWKLLEDLVDRFGPDIVISPSLAINPFCVAYLINRLRKAGVKKGGLLENAIPPLLLKDGWPSQPVMPACNIYVLLPLPSEGADPEINEYIINCYKGLGIEELNKTSTISEDDLLEALRDYFEKKLREAWRVISEAYFGNSHSVLSTKKNGLLRTIDELMKILCGHMSKDREKEGKVIEECMKSCKEFLEEALVIPPVRIRVSCALGREVLDRLKQAINECSSTKEFKEILARLKDRLNTLMKYGLSTKPEDILKDQRIRETLLNTLWLWVATERLKEASKRREPFIETSSGVGLYKHVHKFTKKVYESVDELKRWRTCSVCGIMPAVVRREGVTQQPESAIGFSLLDERENLCPYCLIKRLVAKHPHKVLKRASLRILDRQSDSVVEGVPSTYDVANVWALLPLIASDEELRNALSGIISSEEVTSTSERNLFEYISKAKDFVKEAKNLNEGHVKLGLKITLTEKGLEEILSYDKKLRAKVWNRLALYVAYVKGDGDCVGSGYHRGRLVEFIDAGSESIKTPKEWALEVIKHSGLGSKLPEENREEFQEVLSDAYDLVVRLVTLTLGKALEDNVEGSTFVVTPAYKLALSEALSLTALVDAYLIEALGGIAVYAGGDDVAAILPVIAPVLELEDGAKVNPVLLSLCGALAELFDVKEKSKLKELINNVVKLAGLVSGSNDLSMFASPALLALELTRLNYWGLLRYSFLGDYKGFHIFSNLVIPATAWYGRSYGAMITHYRDPMWVAFSKAGELEELKDEVVRHDKGVKDTVCIAYGRLSGALSDLAEFSAILVNNPGNNPRKPDDVVKPLILASALASATNKPRKVLSRSVLYDAEEYLRTLRKKRVSAQVIESIVKHIICSNTAEASRIEALKIANEFKSIAATSVSLGSDNAARRYIALETFRLARFTLRR